MCENVTSRFDSIKMTESVSARSDNRSIKAVIFDMDGVLVDSEPLHMKASQLVLSRLGFAQSTIEQERFIGVRDSEMWQTLIKELDMDTTVEALTEMRLAVDPIYFNRDTVHPIDGIPELIALIREKGLKIGVATSTASCNVSMMLRLLGFEGTFDSVITGSDVANPKPDPEPYRKAAESLGVHPRNCMAIEDSIHGIRAAKAAGCYTVAYLNPTSGAHDTSPADKVVSSMRQISIDVVLA